MFIHHIAIICSDRAQAVEFYVDKLGFEIISEHVRPKKDDILLNVAKDGLVLELFIKPNAPKRVSGGKLMTFFFDPDGLPLELHE